MDFFMDNASALVIGVVVPLSTMAALAIGCGDNRKALQKKAAEKKKKADAKAQQSRGRAPSSKPAGLQKKHGSKSSSKRSSSKKTKEGTLLAKPDSAKSKPQKLKEPVKSGAKDASKQATSEKLTKLKHKVSSKQSASSKSSSKAKRPSSSARGPLPSSSDKKTSLKATTPQKGLSSRAQRPVPVDTRVEPQHLVFSATGGLQQINVHNNDAKGLRCAIKVMCSNNGLYRVNPVYAFVEPGKCTPLTVYRNNSPAECKSEKLVLAVAKVSNEETDPMKPFEEDDAQPKMLVPLQVSSASEGIAALSRCACVK